MFIPCFVFDEISVKYFVKKLAFVATKTVNSLKIAIQNFEHKLNTAPIQMYRGQRVLNSENTFCMHNLYFFLNFG